jgi:hypothetical protein
VFVRPFRAKRAAKVRGFFYSARKRSKLFFLPPFPVCLAALPVEAGCKGTRRFGVSKSAATFILVLFLVQGWLPVEAGGKGNSLFSSVASQ